VASTQGAPAGVAAARRGTVPQALDVVSQLRRAAAASGSCALDADAGGHVLGGHVLGSIACPPPRALCPLLPALTFPYLLLSAPAAYFGRVYDRRGADERGSQVLPALKRQRRRGGTCQRSGTCVRVRRRAPVLARALVAQHGVWPEVGARAGRLIGLTQSSAQADFAWERQQQCRPEGGQPPPADDDGDCVIS